MNKSIIMTPIPIYQVDAFTDESFKGNPAAICILKKELPESLMQLIASEMNLSETAFVRQLESRPIREAKAFALRWFTPKVEVPLCGHATLATAAVLFKELKIRGKQIVFRTKSGDLIARKDISDICLDFPSDKPERISPPKTLIKALGIEDFEDLAYGRQTQMLLIQLQNYKDVKRVSPNYEAMKHARTKEKINGVVITAVGNVRYDFVSRYFGPWVGIDEDPVTGSAHTLLAPYWEERLGKTKMLAYQASARGGELVVRLKPNARVDLVGKSVTVLKGNLYV